MNDELEGQEPSFGEKFGRNALGAAIGAGMGIGMAVGMDIAGKGFGAAGRKLARNPRVREKVQQGGALAGNLVRNLKDIGKPAAERTVKVQARAMKDNALAGVQMRDLGGADIQSPSQRYANSSTGELAPNVQEFNAVTRAGGSFSPERGTLVDRHFQRLQSDATKSVPPGYQVPERKVAPEVQAYVEQKRNLASPVDLSDQSRQIEVAERATGDLGQGAGQLTATTAGSFASGYARRQGYVDSNPIEQGIKAASADDYQANRQEMRELRRNEDINLNEIDARTDPNYNAATPELSDTAIESIKPAEYETVSNFETFARDPDSGEALNLGVRTTKPMDLTGGDEMPQAAREAGDAVIRRLRNENEAKRMTARKKLEEKGMPVTPSRVERFAATSFPEQVAERESTISSLTKQTQIDGDTGRKTTTYTYTQEVPEGMQEIASGGERALSNFGPDAQIEKTAAGRAIRGGSRISETMGPVERTRQMASNPDALTTPIPDTGDDRLMPTQQQYGEVGTYPEGVQPKAAYTKRVTDPELLGQMGALKQDTDPGRGTGIYGYEKSYTAGAIDRSTGDFTAAAEKQPSLVMKKFEPGTEGMSYPRQVESAGAREIGYPDAGDRAQKVAESQEKMSRYKPGTQRFARAESTATDLTEGAAKRKAAAQLAAKVRDIQMRVNPAQQEAELAKLGIGKTAGPSMRTTSMEGFPRTI